MARKKPMLWNFRKYMEIRKTVRWLKINTSHLTDWAHFLSSVHAQSNTKGCPPSSLTAQHIMPAKNYSCESPKSKKTPANLFTDKWDTTPFKLKIGTSSKSSSLNSSLIEVEKRNYLRNSQIMNFVRNKIRNFLRNSQYKKELIQ
jgi:hypothetical protein